MDTLAKLIIRPTRARYELEDLGMQYLYIRDQLIKRKDFQVKNDYGMTLQCSIFTPGNLIEDSQITKNKYPCLLYCHGNSGSRLESLDLVPIFLPDNILVACFDFSGSGLSEGKYVTLGHNEKEDIKCVIKTLRDVPFISDIAIWGRSMGAASALLYASTDNELAAMALDSPFSSLNQLCQDQMKSFLILTFTLYLSNLIFEVTRSIIKKRANFDVNKISPIDQVHKIKAPLFIFHGKKDKIISIDHSKAIYDKARTEKILVEMDLDHNEIRPFALKCRIKEFIKSKFIEKAYAREYIQDYESNDLEMSMSHFEKNLDCIDPILGEYRTPFKTSIDALAPVNFRQQISKWEINYEPSPFGFETGPYPYDSSIFEQDHGFERSTKVPSENEQNPLLYEVPHTSRHQRKNSKREYDEYAPHLTIQYLKTLI